MESQIILLVTNREDRWFRYWHYMDYSSEEPKDVIVTEIKDGQEAMVWFEFNRYDVTIDDGMGNTKTYTVFPGDYIEEPETPVREGYRFLGWYMYSTSGWLVNFNEPINNTCNIVAKWEKIKEDTSEDNQGDHNSNPENKPSKKGMEIGETCTVKMADNAKVTLLKDKTLSYRNTSYPSGVVIVPKSITVRSKKYKVTTIGKNAFNDTKALRVKLPDTIKRIKKKAFYKDNNLGTIQILSKKITVEKGAFTGMPSKTKKKLVVIVTKKMSKKDYIKLVSTLKKEGISQKNIFKK